MNEIQKLLTIFFVIVIGNSFTFVNPSGDPIIDILYKVLIIILTAGTVITIIKTMF